VAQVEGLAARQPVLRLFEDAQWSDPTSLELLDLIIDRVPALPLLYLPPGVHPALDRPAPGQSARSQPPGAAAWVEMSAGVTGGKALPKEFADQIIDRTDGVPLFVEELTKAMVESGMLSDAGDHYTAAGPVLCWRSRLPCRHRSWPDSTDCAGARAGADRGGARPAVPHELIGAVAVPGPGHHAGAMCEQPQHPRNSSRSNPDSVPMTASACFDRNSSTASPHAQPVLLTRRAYSA
jgi:hypothetical protein